MIRVVVDTNVLVSGILKPGGWEAAVLDLIAEGKLAWCTSEPILNEYQRVLVTKLRLPPLPVQYLLATSQSRSILCAGFGDRCISRRGG